LGGTLAVLGIFAGALLQRRAFRTGIIANEQHATRQLIDQGVAAMSTRTEVPPRSKLRPSIVEIVTIQLKAKMNQARRLLTVRQNGI
jgi:hypothetical protein